MGIASLGGILSGAGNVSAPSGAGGIYKNLLNSFLGSQGQILNTSAATEPGFAGITSGIMSKFAPSATSTVNSINPAGNNLLAQLTQTASEQLQDGANLDPGLETVAQQAVRGAQAARGLGNGPGDAIDEAIQMTQLGNQLRQQRQQFAGNVVGQQFQTQTSPTLALLNAIASRTTSSVAPPNLTGQFLTLPYQAKMQANSETARNNTSLYQSMDQNQTSFFNNLLSV